jgi:hypothetical protein
MKAKTRMHTTVQQEAQRKPREYNFKPGVSGNPGGVSRAERRYKAFLEQFHGVHNRKPNATETTTLHNAAALASRIEGNRIPITEQVRAGNLLTRLLDRLGLSGTPAPAEPKTPVQNLEEACALIREGQR